MIRLRPRPPIPELLKSEKIKEAQKQIEKMIKAGFFLASEDLESHWRKGNIKKTLGDWHYHKCCYCERKRDPNGETDVEHFRPKAGIKEENGHPGYWWLVYEWKNLFFVCKGCNGKKSNRFPLLGGSKRALTCEDDLALEKPVLINPVEEDPAEYIGFDCSGEGKGVYVKAVGLDNDGRGRETINNLTYINDNEVMKRRADLALFLDAIAENVRQADSCNDHDLKNKYLNQMKEQTRADKEFAGFCRAYFRAMGFGDYVSKD